MNRTTLAAKALWNRLLDIAGTLRAASGLGVRFYGYVLASCLLLPLWSGRRNQHETKSSREGKPRGRNWLLRAPKMLPTGIIKSCPRWPRSGNRKMVLRRMVPKDKPTTNDCWGRNGLLPPGDPSQKVSVFAPQLSCWVAPWPEAASTPQDHQLLAFICRHHSAQHHFTGTRPG